MRTHLTPDQNLDSNDEIDKEITVSFSDNEILDKYFSLQLTPQTDFQKKTGRPTDIRTNTF